MRTLPAKVLVEPKDQEMHDGLLRHLASEGAIDEDAGSGVIVITEYACRTLDEPLRLHITAATLGEAARDGR